jgi:hypothetical protein
MYKHSKIEQLAFKIALFSELSLVLRVNLLDWYSIKALITSVPGKLSKLIKIIL